MLIEKIGKTGLPIILPHFPMPEGSVPGATGIISCDPADYAKVAAREIGKVIRGDVFRIEHKGCAVIESSVGVLYNTWAGSLEKALGAR